MNQRQRTITIYALEARIESLALAADPDSPCFREEAPGEIDEIRAIINRLRAENQREDDSIIQSIIDDA